MAGATYAQFIAAVQALDIDGVERTYEQPPRVFNRADLPCKFVWFPSGDNAPLAFGGENASQFRERSLDLIVVYEDTAPKADPSFTETTVLMDAVETALRTLEVGWSTPNWRIEMRLYQETVDRWYWAVVATINGTG